MKISFVKYLLIGSLGLTLSSCNSGSVSPSTETRESKLGYQVNTKNRSNLAYQDDISDAEKILFEKKFGYKPNTNFPEGIIFDIEKVTWPFPYGITTALTPHEKLPFKLMIYNRGSKALQKIYATLFIEIPHQIVYTNNTCEDRIISDQGCEISGYFITSSYEEFGNNGQHPETLFSSINDSEAIRHAWSGYPNQDQDGLYKMRKFNDLVSLTINFFREASDKAIENTNQFQTGEYHSSVMLANKENSSNNYNDVFTSKIRPSKLFTISQGTDGPIIQPNVSYLSPDFYDKNHQQILACNRLAFKESQCPSNVYLKFTHDKTKKDVFLPYQATLEPLNLLPINTLRVTWQQILGKQFVPDITDLSYLEPFLNFRFRLEYIGDEFTELFDEVYPGHYTSKVKIIHYVTNTKQPILVEDVHLKMEF